jgi:hypothetical protein
LTLPGALGSAVAVTLVTVSGAAFTPLAMTPPYQQSQDVGMTFERAQWQYDNMLPPEIWYCDCGIRIDEDETMCADCAQLQALLADAQELADHGDWYDDTADEIEERTSITQALMPAQLATELWQDHYSLGRPM